MYRNAIIIGLIIALCGPALAQGNRSASEAWVLYRLGLATGEVSQAIATLSGRVDALPQPPVSSVNGATGAVSITAASLGALTAEADPVAGPRLDALEAGTNDWRQAWTWGNQWQSWLSTNTYVRAEADTIALASLAKYAATNRVTRWQDSGDPNKWWTSDGGTNLTAWTLSDSQFFFSADQLAGYLQQTTGVFPYVVEGQEEGYFEGGLARLSVNGPGTWRSYDAAFPQTLINDMATYATAYVYRASVVLASYNLTTGNVWQAVASVQASADDALLEAHQAVSQINHHEFVATDPHPGKYVKASEIAGIVYSNAVSQLICWTNATGAVTNMAVCDGGVWKTNAFESVMTLPDGIVTNGQSGVSLAGPTLHIATVYKELMITDGGNIAKFLPTQFYSPFGYAFTYWTGSDVAYALQWSLGDVSIPNGNLDVAGTNTAAELRSLGGYIVGPTIGGKQAYEFSDGTNKFFVSVNNVTNNLTNN